MENYIHIKIHFVNTCHLQIGYWMNQNFIPKYNLAQMRSLFPMGRTNKLPSFIDKYLLQMLTCKCTWFFHEMRLFGDKQTTKIFIARNWNVQPNKFHPLVCPWKITFSWGGSKPRAWCLKGLKMQSHLCIQISCWINWCPTTLTIKVHIM
jgi:hypothetical protein